MKLEPGLKSGGKEDAKKKPHIKKPLNAFMLYMKEMRPKVQYSLKSSTEEVYRTVVFVFPFIFAALGRFTIELSCTVLYIRVM